MITAEKFELLDEADVKDSCKDPKDKRESGHGATVGWVLKYVLEAQSKNNLSKNNQVSTAGRD